MKKGICSDCNKEKLIFAKQKCKRCYYREKRLLRQELAPKIKCQCSPNCQLMIPSINYDGKPMKIAVDHGLKRELNPSWKGGRYMGSMGYWLVYKPEHHLADERGYVLEHRLVYEEYHKCSLLPWAIIHHKNEIKTDNRPENLEVWNRSQHQNLHNPRKGYRKDLSGRTCLECGSDKTQPSYNGQPHWCRHPLTKVEWICETCYRRLVRNHRQSRRRVSVENRVCVKCGTNKSENNMGYLTWRSYEGGGYICKTCFDRKVRVYTPNKP